MCVMDTLQSDLNEENEITNRITIHKLINDLPERDKKIIMLRYFNGNTQTQVSELLGISQVQVSRLEKKLLIQMREKIIS